MASPSPARPPTENQISANPGVRVQLTTHNEEGKAVVKSTTPVKVCNYIMTAGLVLTGASPLTPHSSLLTTPIPPIM